jgi:hypothetical protein
MPVLQLPPPSLILVAEVYALLMGRRRRGAIGRPEWLSEKIYELVRRVVGWNQ